MAVKIRLQRGGATHKPYYRVVVSDERARRDGRFIERVGSYDPKNKKQDLQIALEMERIDYWLGVGAQPTDTVRSLIRQVRRKLPAATKAVPAAPTEAAATATGEVATATEAAATATEAAATATE